MKGKEKETRCHTRSATDVHGFEIAGFDDAHSDDVGCRVVTQRNQQISSTSLEIREHRQIVSASSAPLFLFLFCTFFSFQLPAAHLCFLL